MNFRRSVIAGLSAVTLAFTVTACGPDGGGSSASAEDYRLFRFKGGGRV